MGGGEDCSGTRAGCRAGPGVRQVGPRLGPRGEGPATDGPANGRWRAGTRPDNRPRVKNSVEVRGPERLRRCWTAWVLPLAHVRRGSADSSCSGSPWRALVRHGAQGSGEARRRSGGRRGAGDIVPVTNNERVFAIFVALLGNPPPPSPAASVALCDKNDSLYYTPLYKMSICAVLVRAGLRGAPQSAAGLDPAAQSVAPGGSFACICAFFGWTRDVFYRIFS